MSEQAPSKIPETEQKAAPSVLQSAVVGITAGTVTTPLDLAAHNLSSGQKALAPRRTSYVKLVMGRAANIGLSFALLHGAEQLSKSVRGGNEATPLDTAVGISADAVGTYFLYRPYREHMNGISWAQTYRKIGQELKGGRLAPLGWYASAAALGWLPTKYGAPFLQRSLCTNGISEKTSERIADTSCAVLGSGISNLRNLSIPGSSAANPRAIAMGFARDLLILGAERIASRHLSSGKSAVKRQATEPPTW